MKLFLDANVIFTAAYSAQGLSRGLFRSGCGRKMFSLHIRLCP